MKVKKLKMLAGVMSAVMCVGVLPAITVRAEGYTGWKEADGKKYWYENDVKQGTEGRGKEIYDPASDAWYWLDAPDGTMATSKDVYQESDAGTWGDYVNESGVRSGKWVRYDAEGHMIKGWSTDEKGTYFFDNTFGTMAKGYATIEGKEYYFNEAAGILEKEIGEVPEYGWKTIDGQDYWYEGSVRQGYAVEDTYRGKEIFDPASNAWYWLDNVDGGKKAVNKDVYQDSEAGIWGDYVNNEGVRCGKWVRYDGNGHMVKGWCTTENGTFYFDPIYGTMAKGNAEIEGKEYYFDVNTGVCMGEVGQSQYDWRYTGSITYNDNGTIQYRDVVEYDASNNVLKKTFYCGNKSGYNEKGEYYVSSDNIDSMIVYDEYSYQYDANGEQTGETKKYYSTVCIDENTSEHKSYLWSESAYVVKNGNYVSAIGYIYDENGKVEAKSETTFNSAGEIEKDVVYRDDGAGLVLSYTRTAEFDANGNMTKLMYDYADTGSGAQNETTIYEYDANGNRVKGTTYNNGVAMYEYTYQYAGENMTLQETKNLKEGYVSSRTEYKYDADGNRIESMSYYSSTYNGNREMQPSSKTTWQYNGTEVVSERYMFTRNFDNTYKEIPYVHEVTTYVDADRKLIASYDYYNGRYTIDASGNAQFNYFDGDNWAYSYGYKYEYDANGNEVAEYSYSRKDYQKVLLKYIKYATGNVLSNPDVAGKKEEFTYSTTYDKDNKRLDYEVDYYETYSR